MSVSSVGGGGSSNRSNNDREEPKVQPKPKDPPKVEGAQTQQAGTKTAKNQATPNQVKPDGFETKASSSTQRSQQQAMLGSTTAPEKTEAPEQAQAGALEKVGLTAEDVVMAGTNAAPHLEKAAQAAVQGKYEEALGHLKDAATSSPEIAEKAVRGLAQNLPEGAAKTLLTDKALVHELMSNSGLHSAVGKLLKDPTDLSAVRDLVGNDKFRDATLTALGKDPGVQAQLEKIGLSPQDLVQAGKAAPKLIDSFQKLQSGDVKGALTDFQKAVESAPDLGRQARAEAARQGSAGHQGPVRQARHHPRGSQKSGAALPHLYDAADAAVKGDWQKSLDSLKQAASAAPEVGRRPSRVWPTSSRTASVPSSRCSPTMRSSRSSSPTRTCSDQSRSSSVRLHAHGGPARAVQQ